MNAANWKIGRRLAGAFIVIIAFLVLLTGLSYVQFRMLKDISHRIEDIDWVNANAAMTANALTRANAQRTNELFIAGDTNHAQRILAQIDANRNLITDSLETLRRHVDTAEGKRLLTNVLEQRKAYVNSFSQVIKLLQDNQRDAAKQLMLTETLRLQDSLTDGYKALSDLQAKAVSHRIDEVQETVSTGTLVITGLSLAASLVAITLAFAITRSIVKPLRTAVDIANEVAAGDLTSRIVVRGNDETSQLLAALTRMNRRLGELIRQTGRGAENIASASSQIAAGNLDLSQRTEQQAGSLEETAASIARLTTMVKQNADHASAVNGMARSAADAAVEGGRIVGKVIQSMESINTSANRISEITSVIDGIAFQTNILALNAAVEAARAGEQGRGFAVVAAEVRHLAQRSAAAAKDIKQLIGASVEEVGEGLELVSHAGTSMQEIVARISNVTQIIGDISTASREQTERILRVNAAIAEMDMVTQQNAALVEEAAAAAGALDEQAAVLSRSISRFKIGSDEPPAIDPPSPSLPVPTGTAVHFPNRRGPLARMLHIEGGTRR